MPTYEYQCQSCGYSFERFQAISDPPLSRCPQCGNKVQRLISGGSGLIFKGSGFYQNDYKQDTCCSRGEQCDHPKRCCEN